MIRALFWDNDGVLVDTERLYFEATRRVLATIGIELSEQGFRQHFLIDGRGAWHLAEAAGVPADDIARLKDERNAVYSRLLEDGAFLIDGVREVLESLHGQYIMAVVTSSRRDHFDLIHRATGFLPYFDFVLANGDYPKGKPHPDPYLEAVKRSGVAADECLAIEDSERGLAAARAAGIRCVMLPTPLTRGCGFAGAHCVLEKVADLQSVLDGLNRPSRA